MLSTLLSMRHCYTISFLYQLTTSSEKFHHCHAHYSDKETGSERQTTLSSITHLIEEGVWTRPSATLSLYHVYKPIYPHLRSVLLKGEHPSLYTLHLT